MCNKIQTRAIRIFLGLNSFSPNAGIQEHMGWKFHVIRRLLRMVKYWDRLVCMGDTRLTRRVFIWECSYNKGNWSADMKELFAHIDAQNVFSTRSDSNFDVTAGKMFAQMITSWKQEVHAKPKLRTYATFNSIELNLMLS